MVTFKSGDRVQDIVTGAEGVVVGFHNSFPAVGMVGGVMIHSGPGMVALVWDRDALRYKETGDLPLVHQVFDSQVYHPLEPC